MKTVASLLSFLLAAGLLSAKPPADLQLQLDGWIKGQPGGVAAAWVDADGTAFFQAGRLDGADSGLVTPDTRFELGSVTKVFTSLLLAQSEQAGKVSRNDPAAKYLLPADDPAQAKLAKITLLSLATHTSGLPRLPGNIGPNPDGNPDPYAGYERAALIAALVSHGPSAIPGPPAYSNFGVAVLGEALAAAWGVSYADALREHVLAPLGLKATGTGLAGANDVAPGHVLDARVPNWHFAAFAPAGGLQSSARDLAAFLSACLGYRENPLRAALAMTVESQFANPDTGGHIGLAWLLADDPAHPIVWHNGATGGSHAFIGFDPQAGTGLVVLANTQKGSEALAFAALGGQPPRPDTTVANPNDYPGRYPLSSAFAIDITVVNGALFAQATGQARLGLRPIAADRFALIGVAAEIWFERGADGQVLALVLHQNGQTPRGPRTALPAVTHLPVEILREYVGNYPLGAQFVLAVSETDGALFVQATGQSKFPVFASAKDEFFYKVVDARLSFQRDAGGKVVGVILHQNGRDLPAQKSP